MRRWEEPARAKARIEVIPMIDVMMFLLVFFVLISVNVIPAMGIRTQLPVSAETQKFEQRKNAVITIAKDGQMQLDGAPVELSLLAALLAQRRVPGQELQITINADEGVTVQQLIDVFDVLKANGYGAVNIAAHPKKP
jgi:biopolymer transport protein ExbD